MSEMTNNITKKTKTKKVICQLLSFIITILPILIYVVIGFANGDIHKGQKIFLGFTLIVSVILVLTNILMKYHLRSPLFILLLGVYYALDNILPLIIIVSVGVVVDEFILQPLVRKYKLKYEVNKELDNRL